MKLQLYANSVLWMANALTWGFWAGSVFMALASLVFAVGSVWAASRLDDWRY